MSTFTYVYEVAPWCQSNMHDAEHIEVSGVHADVADEIAIARTVDEHLPIDRDAWAQLPATFDGARGDDRTIAGFNITGLRGTDKTRLARLKP